MTGVELIVAERARQVGEEGYNALHDDQHENGELAQAAACYAVSSPLLRPVRVSKDGETVAMINIASVLWPWRWSDWKPTPGDRVRELVKAGALIAAEIDRLSRREPPP